MVFNTTQKQVPSLTQVFTKSRQLGKILHSTNKTSARNSTSLKTALTHSNNFITIVCLAPNHKDWTFFVPPSKTTAPRHLKET